MLFLIHPPAQCVTFHHPQICNTPVTLLYMLWYISIMHLQWIIVRWGVVNASYRARGPAVLLSVSESFFGSAAEVKLCETATWGQPLGNARQLQHCGSLARTMYVIMLTPGSEALKGHLLWSGTKGIMFLRGIQTASLSIFYGNICVLYLTVLAKSQRIRISFISTQSSRKISLCFGLCFIHCSATTFSGSLELYLAYGQYISITSRTQTKTIT